MKSHTSKVPEFSFFWNLTSLQRKKIKAMPYYSGNTAPEGRARGKKMKKKKSTTESPVLSKFCSVFDSCVCMLGVGDIWSDKCISLYNLDVFLHSGCVFCLCAWRSLLQNQPAVQRADIECWDDNRKCSDADVGVLRGTASGSRRLFQRILLPRGNQRLDLHLNNEKLGAVMAWYLCSWSIATELCQGWIKSCVSNNSGGKVGLLQGLASEKVCYIALLCTAVNESRVPSLDLEVLTWSPKASLVFNGGEPDSLTGIHNKQRIHCCST